LSSTTYSVHRAASFSQRGQRTLSGAVVPVLTLDDVGQALHVEDPASFTRAVLGFLN